MDALASPPLLSPSRKFKNLIDPSNYMSSTIKPDKIEGNPKYRAILDAAEQEVEEECKESKGQMGHCHAVWGAKRGFWPKSTISSGSPPPN